MIVFPTSDPQGLLAALKSKIDAKGIRTWTYDGDGDFTHTADQWNREAWMRPAVTVDGLVMSIVPPKGEHISSVIYAIYHGRFVETVIRHFDTSLAGPVSVSPLPEGDDQIE